MYIHICICISAPGPHMATGDGVLPARGRREVGVNTNHDGCNTARNMISIHSTSGNINIRKHDNTMVILTVVIILYMTDNDANIMGVEGRATEVQGPGPSLPADCQYDTF